MTYKETVDFLFEQLPQFQNIGGKAYNGKLDNITDICELLDNPQNKFKTIHIAGTNGKGSVCNMLASIFTQSGYTVGLFTSPHLLDFRERIRINGEVIPENYVIDFVKKHNTVFNNIQPSFFEWSAALAFNYFEYKKVDIAIIETGLGGRLDSTNIITPLVSAITSIGIDHTQYLGNTLEDIAREKGGIIKPNIPVVLGEGIEKQSIFEEIALTNNSLVHIATQNNNQHVSSLKGDFQKNNVATALTIIDLIQQQFSAITSASINKGLLSIKTNTGLRGRWETLQKSPKVIADIGHNVHAITETVKELELETYNNLHIIWGMVEEKEIDKVINLLPENANYYLCTPNIPRALSTKELEKSFAKKQSKISISSCSEAFKAAIKTAKPYDLIVVGGSTFVVSEILRDFYS
ncbi:MAG: bifunctional folylpolyglutamate synthase/dihydrofolate synthase [Flavobacteriales bacterium]|nr:bifunctional folylpolyglutamate synthase/dihydrofolate synthase [Flavobacteriales bacterium]